MLTGSLIGLAIQLIIIGVIVWAIWFVTTSLPVPDPLGKIIRVLVMVIAVIAVLFILLHAIGLGPAAV